MATYRDGNGAQRLEFRDRDALQVSLLQANSALLEVQRHADRGELDDAIQTLEGLQTQVEAALERLKHAVHPALY